MLLAKGGKAWDQPFGGKRRGYAEGDTTDSWSKLCRGGFDDLDRASDGAVIGSAVGCESEAARQAGEQRLAKIGFKMAHLLRDGALGQVQLFRRAAEVQMPGGGIEHPQGVEIWGTHRCLQASRFSTALRDER